jgi:hypothetical protein
LENIKQRANKVGAVKLEMADEMLNAQEFEILSIKSIITTRLTKQ